MSKITNLRPEHALCVTLFRVAKFDVFPDSSESTLGTGFVKLVVGWLSGNVS